MPLFRTDLTLETAEQLGITGKKAKNLPGVQVTHYSSEGYTVTDVTVIDDAGSRALGRPQGQYITVDLQPYFLRQEHFFPRGVHCLSRELLRLLPRLQDGDAVLVAGLGNRHLSCDAVGPMAVENLLVTRHMITDQPHHFRNLLPVAAISPGVVGQTGVETLELIAGIAQRISPAAIIVIDALCAHSHHRLCTTVQLSDTGLSPGSGVGNHRNAIDQVSLGVPVIAIGIPTVIAGNTLAQELTGQSTKAPTDLFLTPRDISSRVAELGRLVGYAISSALHPSLSVEDITGLLS